MNKPLPFLTDLNAASITPKALLITPFISVETSMLSQLDHLIWMAQFDGWKEYVWHRVKELDKTQLFMGIKSQFLERIKNVSNDVHNPRRATGKR
jgi:hypothetical protein